MTTFGHDYRTDIVNGSKLIKLKHAYLATSGYGLLYDVFQHLLSGGHKLMDNTFSDSVQVFSFFLDFYNELKKSYTLVEPGKETYASMYNDFLAVTPTKIYGISTNLSVSEYETFIAKGSGAGHAEGCLYAMYDRFDDGLELTRLALETACHFSLYCKEPLDIKEVKASDFEIKRRTDRLRAVRGRQGRGSNLKVNRRAV